MNKTARNIGLITLAAGALVYPAFRLYKYIAQKRKNVAPEENHPIKAFAPSYRGKSKHRHTKVDADGQLHPGLGLA